MVRDMKTFGDVTEEQLEPDIGATADIVKRQGPKYGPIAVMMVQERLDHIPFVPTMDTCGHLFPKTHEAREPVTAEKALLL
ncbi:hypothetical protein O7A70_03385 [Mesorhizobium sp. Cs1299R1N1]|uniref:hypothetical protein n=1 Tax=Mesorhizobium sp. Cs1299R1N1 TaxID=3015172 RepID=UPI00301DAB28